MFHNRLYLSIVSSHFVIDLLSGTCGVLLAVLSGPLHLSNAQIATAVTLYALIAALSQPLFGWLTDRVPEQESGISAAPLLLVSASVLWMGLCFSVVSFMPTWGLVLTFLLLGALGSGLFHPIGTSHSTVVHNGSANVAASVFFLFGQMGLATGPVVGGFLFDAAGSRGVLPLASLTVIPAAMMLASVGMRSAVQPALPRPLEKAGQNGTHTLRRLSSLMILVFVLLVALRSTIQSVYQFLLPKLFEDRGWEPSLYGMLAGAFLAMGAVGNVIVGQLADRYGMRAVTILSLLISVPVGLLFLSTPSVPLTFLTCAVVGFLTGGQHSVLVVHAQRLLPVRKGFAAGLILGFTFASGAVGTWLCGFAADSYGLQQSMLVVALLGLPGALLALTLPGQGE